MKQDIRPLRIGILNIMPIANTYEYNILFPIGRSIIQIEPVWIRLKTHPYKSTSKAHLDELYVSFEDAVRERGFDGLIVTGAPVEEKKFSEVWFWDELKEILTYAKRILHPPWVYAGADLPLRVSTVFQKPYTPKRYPVFIPLKT